MADDVYIELHVNHDAAAQVRAKILAATKQVFAVDIVPDAVANSPVTPDGYNRNLEEGKKGVKATGTGHNRQSIDFTVTEEAAGTKAELFTQSGYGGYLEVGTSKMRAQPYLYPALAKFVDRISELVKAKIKEGV